MKLAGKLTTDNSGTAKWGFAKKVLKLFHQGIPYTRLSYRREFIHAKSHRNS